MNGIHVFTRSYENRASLEDHHTAGADRQRVLDAALAKVPASVRAGLARKLGRALELDLEEHTLVSGDVVVDGDYAAAWVRACEVVS